jgi:hypothetical protein
VVVLCNVAEVSDGAAETLARFVTAGGGLLIFTGDRVRAGAYDPLRRRGLLPVQVQGPGDLGLYHWADWQKDHPIFRAFDEPEHGDLRSLSFQRLTRLVVDAPVRVLATAEGKLPMLVESSAGRGRCLLVAVPADNQWGGWAARRLYLPVVHQLLGYLTDRLPDAGRVRAERAGSGPERAAGVVIDGERAVVRNLDPAESEIERTTIAMLREVYRLPVPHSEDHTSDRSLALSLPGSQRPDELWFGITAMLLGVLVAETFVANRTFV